MMPPDEFRTSGLVLRKPTPSDAEALFRAYATDPEVTRYLSWRPHENIEDTRRYVASCLERWEAQEGRTYVIDAEGVGRPAVGALGLRQGTHDFTFGYVLARPFWRRGYMTEALTAVVRWAAAEPEVWRMWGTCDVDNVASARVMEKAGLAFEAILRRWAVNPNLDPHRPRDFRVFALVK